MKSYLVARKLNNRSFITADPVTDDRGKAETLAKHYALDPLWQGAEIVVMWNRLEIERIPIEKTLQID